MVDITIHRIQYTFICLETHGPRGATPTDTPLSGPGWINN